MADTHYIIVSDSDCSENGAWESTRSGVYDQAAVDVTADARSENVANGASIHGEVRAELVQAMTGPIYPEQPYPVSTHAIPSYQAPVSYPVPPARLGHTQSGYNQPVYNQQGYNQQGYHQQGYPQQQLLPNGYNQPAQGQIQPQAHIQQGQPQPVRTYQGQTYAELRYPGPVYPGPSYQARAYQNQINPWQTQPGQFHQGQMQSGHNHGGDNQPAQAQQRPIQPGQVEREHNQPQGRIQPGQPQPSQAQPSTTQPAQSNYISSLPRRAFSDLVYNMTIEIAPEIRWGERGMQRLQEGVERRLRLDFRILREIARRRGRVTIMEVDLETFEALCLLMNIRRGRESSG